MAWFQAFREYEGFAHYSSHRSAVSVDKDFVAVVYICVLVFLASVLAAVGSRGREGRTAVIRVAYSVIVASVILFCLYGHGWQVGEVTAETTYLFRTAEKINATIGIKMNLMNVNITLTGKYGNNSAEVNYNERFHWGSVGELQVEYNTKLVQGMPAPLVTIAEYICSDFGGIRWGRYFREAGYYGYILLWSSFAFWIVTIILMCSVVLFGAIMFTISGMTMCVTVGVYAGLQPAYPLEIPFGNQVLRLHYNWCFYLLSVTGAITMILGIIILIFKNKKPKATEAFFGMECEFNDADDNAQQLLNSRSGNQVAVSSTSGGYSNLGFRASYDNLQSENASSSESQGETSGENINNMTDKESSSLSNTVDQRSMCVKTDDVETSDDDIEQMHIETYSDNLTIPRGNSCQEKEEPRLFYCEIEQPRITCREIKKQPRITVGEMEKPPSNSVGGMENQPCITVGEMEKQPSNSVGEMEEQPSNSVSEIVSISEEDQGATYSSTKF